MTLKVIENLNKNALNDSEKLKTPTTYWFSIYAASALSFICSVQFTIFFSSTWAYIQIIDYSITEVFFGYVISFYSLGQIISSLIFGYLSNRLLKVGPILYFGFFLMFIGDISYIALEVVKFPSYVLIIGRFITGFGSGNITLLRTYASTASVPKDRSKAIAFIICGQALALTGGPIIQLLFTAIKYPGFKLFNTLHINLYTAPAYLACLLNVLGVIVIYFFLDEKYEGVIELKNNNDSQKNVILPPYDVIAVIICLLTRFTFSTIKINLEVIALPYSMMMFSWTKSTTVFYTSLAQGIIGFNALLIYIIWITMRLERYFNFRLTSVLCFIILLLFHLITYSWPFLSEKVNLHQITASWSINAIDTIHEPVGCDFKRFNWCKTVKAINAWLYYIAYIFSMSFAVPLLNIINPTLYSEIIGPRRQGTEQSFLQISGAISRFVGPITISTFYTIYGPTMAWNIEIIIILIILSLWFTFYNRMIPLLERYQCNNIIQKNNK